MSRYTSLALLLIALGCLWRLAVVLHRAWQQAARPEEPAPVTYEEWRAGHRPWSPARVLRRRLRRWRNRRAA